MVDSRGTYSKLPTAAMLPSPELWTPPIIVVVGTGMNRDDLSSRAMAYVEKAQVLVGGRRQLAWFDSLDVQRIVIESPLEKVFDRVEELSPVLRTVFLASGDPLFFGIGRRILRRWGKDRVVFIPSVTSAQVLCSRLALPWDGVGFLSLHGRKRRGWKRLIHPSRPTVVLTDPSYPPSKMAEDLLAEGCAHLRMVVGEDLGSDGEKIRSLSLQEAASQDFAKLCTVIFIPGEGILEEGEDDLPLLGIDEASFVHRKGLITKKEVRSVILSCLDLRSGLVLWDVGAGSGSVGIEAARVADPDAVYAVEKSRERFNDLCLNAARLGRGRVVPVLGEAPAILEELPDPHRVFVGGAGGKMVGILESIKDRIKAGGRCVHALVTWEGFHASRSFWLEAGWKVETIQVQVNRSVPIGMSLMFQAFNPVFVVTAWQEEPSVAEVGPGKEAGQGTP